MEEECEDCGKIAVLDEVFCLCKSCLAEFEINQAEKAWEKKFRDYWEGDWVHEKTRAV